MAIDVSIKHIGPLFNETIFFPKSQYQITIISRATSGKDQKPEK
jgi:hypothetical protein